MVRPRIEVADLLEAHDQLEDVLDRDGVAQAVEMHHAVLLGEVVGFALGRRQLDVQVLDDARRHVGGHVLLGAAQDAIARQCRQHPRRRVGWDAFLVHEGENVDEVLNLVLDRRAGHGPAAGAANRAHRLGRLGAAGLDALGLVQHHDVELEFRVGQLIRRRGSAARN